MKREPSGYETFDVRVDARPDWIRLRGREQLVSFLRRHVPAHSVNQIADLMSDPYRPTGAEASYQFNDIRITVRRN